MTGPYDCSGNDKGLAALARAEHARRAEENARRLRAEAAKWDVKSQTAKRFYVAAKRCDTRAGKEDTKYR